METMAKVIVDTDCGIDDAMALLLTFNDKTKHEVVAITCCHGNASLENVCQNVKRVLNACGQKDVPVYRGCSGALISGKRTESWKSFHGADGFGNCSDEFPTGDINEAAGPAAIALIHSTLKYPGEISLIAVGPLTNIALAQRIDPLFTHRLKSISIMGGNYQGVGNETSVAEFNFYADPEAAEIVLRESKCPVIMVPWETTKIYGIQWETYEKLIEVQTAKGTLLRKVTKFRADLMRKVGNETFYDCDLLAVAALLYPQSVTSSIERALVVECRGAESRGLTVLLNEKNPSVQVKKKVKIITEFNSKILDKLRFEMLN